MIITGSSSLGLITGAGEALAGRTRIFRLYPMGVAEIVGLMENDNRYSEEAYKLVENTINYIWDGDYLDLSYVFKGFGRVEKH